MNAFVVSEISLLDFHSGYFENEFTNLIIFIISNSCKMVLLYYAKIYTQIENVVFGRINLNKHLIESDLN